MYKRRFSLPSQEVKEVVYLIFVKCSTLPVYPFMFGYDIDPAGSVFISNITTCDLDKDSTLSESTKYHELTSEFGFDGCYESIKDADFLIDFDDFLQVQSRGL